MPRIRGPAGKSVPALRTGAEVEMTDKELFTALMYCFVEDPKERKCSSYCPLINEINCRMMLYDEIKHRKCQARRDENNGYKQISML